jgi:hypothetical protein
VPGLCGVDSLILVSWLKSIGAKKVVEFGCGTTTKRMTVAGFEVTSFSKGLPGNLGKESNIEFIKCNLFSIDKNVVLAHINDADAIVIDCEHSWAFPKYYHENFLNKTDRPIWIHDVFNYRTLNAYRYGEAKYLYEEVFNKTHEIFAMTDIPSRIPQLTELFGMNIKKHQGKTGTVVCSVILNKIEV